MAPTLTLFSLLSELINEANDGLHQAMEASKNELTAFTIPQIDMELKCTVLENEGLRFVPANAGQANYYGDAGDSQIKLSLKLKP
jgi:hypothetical protein